MAVHANVSAGHDAGYPFRQMGTADRGAYQAARGTGYYLNAMEKGGEPPGVYHGEALAELGIHDGDEVAREQFEPLFGQFITPTGETLGRPLRQGASAATRYQQKAGDASGLTDDDKAALRAQARAEASALGKCPGQLLRRDAERG